MRSPRPNADESRTEWATSRGPASYSVVRLPMTLVKMMLPKVAMNRGTMAFISMDMTCVFLHGMMRRSVDTELLEQDQEADDKGVIGRLASAYIDSPDAPQCWSEEVRR